ncbi:MAG: cofactor-independent phosphoglycerate mutase [Phycisphaerae bacterium]
MKYAIVIPDGAADLPCEDLGGKTPLEAADTPNMDWIAAHGRCGLVRTVPKGLYAGSDVAILSVLGYDPKHYYTGRAPLEAAAQDLKIGPDEWVFRCNFVTIVDGRMEDYSAGHISSKEASALIDELNRLLADERVRFYPGVSYRHLMTFKGDCRHVLTTPPHDISGQAVAQHMPVGGGGDALRVLIQRSGAILENQEINIVRRDLGENPANSIWLWGQGRMPQLPSFIERFGIKGAAITAVDLVRGLAKLIGWECVSVPGATGYLDTNYAGKGAAAAEALNRLDIVCVHVEATDEAGHNADAAGKAEALTKIDKHIVGPILARLRDEGDQWRILVMPDHPTPCSVRTHTADPVPFAIAGARVSSIKQSPFTEAAAAEGDLQVERGHELMEYFLTVR